jgi:hypothetical protein
MAKHFRDYAPLVADAADRRTLDTAIAEWRAYTRATAGAVTASKRGDVNGAVAVLQNAKTRQAYLASATAGARRAMARPSRRLIGAPTTAA